MDKNTNYETAMMWWKGLEDSEQESKKRKTIGRDEEMNDDEERQDEELDNEKHIQNTVYTGN